MKHTRIEELVPYLPYTPKMLNGVIMGDEVIFPIVGYSDNNIHLDNKGHKLLMDLRLFRRALILRPIYTINERITHKGESFVPSERLKELFPNTPNWDYVAENFYGDDMSETITEHCVVNKLNEWMFDTMGLIGKGRAVDAETLRINPYEK